MTARAGSKAHIRKCEIAIPESVAPATKPNHTLASIRARLNGGGRVEEQCWQTKIEDQRAKNIAVLGLDQADLAGQEAEHNDKGDRDERVDYHGQR